MRVAAFLLLIAAIAGWLVPGKPVEGPRAMGEYVVLAGDFHLHMFPFDGATLAPWDVVLESQRRGLHVIALTGHNQVSTARVGRWFSRLIGGPLVLVGEEIITTPYDMIAVGLERTIDWHGTAAESVARIHEQNGVAIAAHPVQGYWPAYDEAAMRALDGAELLHPMAYAGPEFYAQLHEFYARKPLTAIGSSDFHGTAYPGFSRTYVFAREVSDKAVLEALREHRTVLVDRDGRSYGDPALIRLAEANGGLPRTGVIEESGTWAVISRIATLAAMLVAVLFGFKSAETTPRAARSGGPRA